MKRGLEKLLENLIVVLMILLAAVVISGFLFRKFGSPLTWYDEAAPIVLAWLTYYGACLAALKQAHIGFPKLVAKAPPRLRLVLLAVRAVCVVGFFALAAWAGWRVLGVLDGVYLVSLEWVPVTLTRSVIPLSAVLFILAELLVLAEDWRRASEELS